MRISNYSQLKNVAKAIGMISLICLLAGMPELTFASPFAGGGSGDVSSIDAALNGILQILQGKTSRLLATIAIAGIGYATMTGRLAIKNAVLIGLGIGVVFGAPSIASILGAGT